LQFNLSCAEVDPNAVVHLRVHKHAGKRRVAPAVGIERGDAHQAVHAGLALEAAVGVFPADVEGCALDPGLLPGLMVQELRLVSFCVGPAHVHAQKHVGPILALSPPCAGVDLKDGVARIVRLIQKAFQLQAVELSFERPRLGSNFRVHVFALLLCQKLERLDIFGLLLYLFPGLDPLFIAGDALLDLTRAGRIVPKIGIHPLLI